MVEFEGDEKKKKLKSCEMTDPTSLTATVAATVSSSKLPAPVNVAAFIGLTTSITNEGDRTTVSCAVHTKSDL